MSEYGSSTYGDEIYGDTGSSSTSVVNESMSVEASSSINITESIVSDYGGTAALGNEIGTVIGTEAAQSIVTDSGSITSASATPLESREATSSKTSIIYDDFEDGDISEYSTDGADKSRYTVVDESNVSFNAIDGSKMLEIAGTGDTDRLYTKPGDGLDNYYSKGDGKLIFYYRQQGTSWSGQMRFLFSYIDTGNYYDITFKEGDDFTLNKNNSGSYSNLAAGLLDSVQNTEEWYRFEILWSDGSDGNSDGYIQAEMFTENGDTPLESISATDTSLNAEGFAFRGYSNNESMFFDSAVSGGTQATIDSGLPVGADATPIQAPTTATVTDYGPGTKYGEEYGDIYGGSRSDIVIDVTPIDASSVAGITDVGGVVTGTVTPIEITAYVGAFESMSTTVEAESSFGTHGVANESLGVYTSQGYGKHYGNVYGGDIHRIMSLGESVIAQERISATGTSLMDVRGTAVGVDGASMSASATPSITELKIIIEQMSALADISVSMDDYAWAYATMDTQVAISQSFTEFAAIAVSLSITSSADVSVIETGHADESQTITEDVTPRITAYAPVVAGFTTTTPDVLFNISDFGIANETTSQISVTTALTIIEQAIADAYMTMRSTHATPSIDEIGVVTDSGSVTVPALSEIAAFGIAKETGSVEASTIQEIEETIFEEIVNEAASMTIDADTNLFHAVELYHTVTGNSPSEVEYPRHEVRYEE